jgi:hypothetical protein
MSCAAAAFGPIHVIELIIASIPNTDLSNVKLIAFITATFVGILESAVFLLIGLVVAYVPWRLFATSILAQEPSRLVAFTMSGVLAGILFLPFCAAVSFFITYEPDAPRYLSRCAEFAFPMMVAGAVGGYVFFYYLGKESGLTNEEK